MSSLSAPPQSPTTSADARTAALASADAVVAQNAGALVALSHGVHGLAELAFEEHRSATLVAAPLAAAGFEVSTGVAGLPTAFTARYGTGALHVGICAEYDALPDIGHACGHNIIAASGVGAALALASVADDLDLSVTVLGTPAEEHGGGKVLMLEAGVFDDLTIALMVHPGQDDVDPVGSTSQGVVRFAVTYRGRAAHAAAAPERAVNAADAAVVAQVAVGLLRQQLPGTARVAAFVRQGGQVTNIVPEHVVVEAEVREFDIAAQRELYARVVRCFEAGALATGCAMEIEQTEPPYEPLRQDRRLGTAYRDALAAVDRTPGTPRLGGGSTDMGNVSQYLPAIHPIIGVTGSQNPPHTHGFAADALTTAADQTVLDGARAMAHTVITVASDPESRAALLAEQALRLPFSQTQEI